MSNDSGMGRLMSQADKQVTDREVHALDARLDGEPLSPVQKRAHVTLLVQAGADTTGTALTHHSHPSIFKTFDRSQVDDLGTYSQALIHASSNIQERLPHKEDYRRMCTEPDLGGVRINPAIQILIFDTARLGLLQTLASSALEEDWSSIRCIAISHAIWNPFYGRIKVCDFPVGLEALLVVQDAIGEQPTLHWTELMKEQLKIFESHLKNEELSWKTKTRLFKEELRSLKVDTNKEILS
ncbi:hypothetical protein BDZ45DRAFT_809783 [Acephala macrosclerotiorum]|nr:hypothetical protein BDZ45DRAFT_809783 [Acephala macrosclerotiorum]